MCVCNVQAAAGANLGEDGVNALQLLEFNAKLEKVQQQHRACVTAHVAFWSELKPKRAGRKHHKGRVKADEEAQDKLSKLDKLDKLFSLHDVSSKTLLAAQHGYQDLLERFPRSVEIMRSYASLLDVVCNRCVTANKDRCVRRSAACDRGVRHIDDAAVRQPDWTWCATDVQQGMLGAPTWLATPAEPMREAVQPARRACNRRWGATGVA